MLGTLLFVAQVVAAPLQSATEERPVRLWLGASPVTTGSEMPVYVAAANDGYLLVLRVGTDGRVSVVFPADPKTQGRVTRGTYELREASGRPALVVNEGRGTGLVFAALSEKPFRFGEFSRTGRWDSALLVASHPGADGPGTLMDIAQRMLGDGWFNSAFALYTVRAQSDALRQAQRRAAPSAPGLQEPRTDAQGRNGEDAQATIAACHGCTIVYQTVLPTPVIEQTVVERSFIEPAWILANSCDVRLGNCGFVGDTGFDRGRGLPRLKTEGVCSIGIDCPRSVVPTGMAVKMRTTSLSMSPISRPTPPAPQLPPGDYSVPAPVLASTTVASRMILSKAAPVSSGAVVRRVVRQPAGGVAAPQARTAPVVQRTGGAMTARQTGTALRAARILPRR